MRATFDSTFESDRISAVQYVRFPVEHPNYREATELAGESRQSLIRDLSDP